MNTISKIASLSVLGFMLSGCTSINMLEEDPLVMPERDELRDSVVERFEREENGITYMPGYTPLTIEKPIVMPPSIRNQQVDLVFNNNTTFRDIPAILEVFDIVTVIRNDGLSDEAVLAPSRYSERRENLSTANNNQAGGLPSGPAQNPNQPPMPDPMMRNPIDFDPMGNPIFAEDVVVVEAFDSANRQFQEVTYLSQFRTQIEDIQIGLPRYEGTVGGFLNLLADLHNVSFNWKYGNYMVIERFADYVITVPQEEELMQEIVSEIEKLNADDITSSLRAGTITYKATKDNHDRITRYINRLTYNSPDVGIQMAIISVDLSENLQSGFDWSKLQAGVGSGFGTDGVRGSIAIDGGQQMGIKLSGPGAEVEAAISILDRYGDTRTEQSVLLKTIGGKPVSFDTVQTIPYVSGVSSETVASESEDGNDNVATNIETETQEVGLTLDIMPYYDADSQLFTMDISFESSSILGFTDLSEDIRQPNVQRQTFENSVKLKPGEAIILGGLTYNSTSEEKQGANFFEDRLDFAHTSFERTRRAMFIILRPSVKIYGNFEEMKVEE